MKFATTKQMPTLIGFAVPPQTLRDWERRGAFPRRFRIGRRVYWLRTELLEWAAAKAAERERADA